MSTQIIKATLLNPQTDLEVYLEVKGLDVVATLTLVLKEQAIAMVEQQTLLQTMIGLWLPFFVLL